MPQKWPYNMAETDIYNGPRNNSHCYLCDSRAGVSIRNSVCIFADQIGLLSSRKLPELIESLIDFSPKVNAVHSTIICKKCFKIVQEYDELHVRMEEIKRDMKAQLERTLSRYNVPSSEPSLIKMTVANVQPLPPNVVIMHQGRKLSIQKTNGKVPPAIEDHKYPLPEVPLKTDETAMAVDDKTIADNEGVTAEGTAIPTRMGDDADAEDDGDNMSENDDDDDEEMEPDDYHTLEVDEDAIIIKNNEEDNCSVIKVLKSDSSSRNRIMLTDKDGKEIALLLSDPSEDPDNAAGEESDERDRDADDLEDQESNEGKQIALEIAGDNSSRSVYRLSSGDTYVKVEPGGDLAKTLGIMAKNKSIRFDAPIVDRDGELYTCLLCSNASEDLENSSKVETGFVGVGGAVSGHMRRAHGLRVHVCDVCGELLRRRADYNSHMEKHLEDGEADGSETSKVYQCSICDRAFSSLTLFRLHRRMAHGTPNKANVDAVKHHQCNICRKKYSSRNLLEEHMNTHNGVRPYECLSCLKTFASKYTYHAHLKTHTDRPRAFPCSVCSKAFYTIQNLNQHEKTHSGIKAYVCKVCGKAFGTSHNLVVHGVVHSGHKPHVCRTCGKAFARRAEIRDHERTHTGERPYTCDICPASFSQRSNLQSHKRATHLDDKRYACQSCDKRFKRRRLLEYHVKASHTGERPFCCEVCQATFVYPEHFKKHRRIHSGEKPYHCEVCGKTFNSRDNRNAHRFIHSDKKPYECVRCGNGFMRKPLLFAHMNSMGHQSDTIIVNQPRVAVETRTRTKIANIASSALLEETSQDVANSRKLAIMSIKPEEEEMTLDADDISTSAKMLISGEHFIIHDGDSDRIYTTESVGDDDMSSRQLIFTTPQGDELDKSTLSLVHGSISDESEMLSLVTKHEADEEASAELVDDDSCTQLDSDQVEIVTDENGHVITSVGDNGLLRLVQVRLPNGGKGWVAIDA